MLFCFGSWIDRIEGTSIPQEFQMGRTERDLRVIDRRYPTFKILVGFKLLAVDENP